MWAQIVLINYTKDTLVLIRERMCRKSYGNLNLLHIYQDAAAECL